MSFSRFSGAHYGGLLVCVPSVCQLDRAEIEVKRLTRQYEAARKKADFLEQTHVPAHQAAPQQPIQPISSMQQSPQQGSRMSAYQPIPFSQSMMPPTFKASA
jgi:hypothetical protein